jgi:glyoxylase-like metal-dependent hydrolase (beta-lactamase superfamily II)
MKIIPLSEGSFTIDKSKILIPFDSSKDILQHRASGSLLVEIQPFLIITEKDILLIDTGLGYADHGEMQLHANLKANGIHPDQITKVIMSHLHKDHAGGISKRDQLGNYFPAFPKAQFYVQKKEYDYAVDTGYPSYMTEELSVLENNPSVNWLDGNGSIDGYIFYEVTGAHSPFHQVIWIKEKEEILFFGGDDAPQLQQMKSRFVAKYDFNGKLCMELRQQWWLKAKTENWIFLFYHDIKTPYYQQTES